MHYYYNVYVYEKQKSMRLLLLIIVIMFCFCCHSIKDETSMYIKGYDDGWKACSEYKADSLAKAKK